MRRLARHLWTLCSAISLLLCVAACLAWFRSHRMQEETVWWPARTSSTIHLFWSEGDVVLCKSSDHRDSGLQPGEFEFSADPNHMDLYEWWQKPWPETGRVTKGGFGVYREPGGTGWGVLLPLWFITASAAVLPLGWGGGACRALRARAAAAAAARRGLCRRCGYDLRASPDRCPECGTVASA